MYTNLHVHSHFYLLLYLSVYIFKSMSHMIPLTPIHHKVHSSLPPFLALIMCSMFTCLFNPNIPIKQVHNSQLILRKTDLLTRVSIGVLFFVFLALQYAVKMLFSKVTWVSSFFPPSPLLLCQPFIIQLGSFVTVYISFLVSFHILVDSVTYFGGHM